MPRRFMPIIANEYYHVFNRTIEKRLIFTELPYIQRALTILDYYRFNQSISYSTFKNMYYQRANNYILSIKKFQPLANIYCYAIMPTHFHLLLKQVQPKGIEKFISNFQNSFAKFFNLVNGRTGSLFQSQFKAVPINNPYQFVRVANYIHLNPVVANLLKLNDLESSPITSLHGYRNTWDRGFVETQPLMRYFGSYERYKRFLYSSFEF